MNTQKTKAPGHPVVGYDTLPLGRNQTASSSVDL